MANAKLLEVAFNLKSTPYKSLENVGTGAYGVVCKAFDQVRIYGLPSEAAKHNFLLDFFCS